MAATKEHLSKIGFKKGDPRINRNGRPKKSDRLDAIFDKTVSDDDIQAIISSMKQKAKGGDMKAAEMLLDRYFGKPIARNAMTDTEGNDIEPKEMPIIVIGNSDKIKDSISKLNDNIK